MPYKPKDPRLAYHAKRRPKGGTPPKLKGKPPHKPREKVMGRPEHVRSEVAAGLIKMFVVMGFTQAQIADYGKVDSKTLRKHYRAELDESYMTLGATLVHTAFQKAIGATADKDGLLKPNVDKADAGMLKFMLERKFGFKTEAQQHQHTGVIGTFDYSKLSDDQIVTLEAILSSVDGGEQADVIGIEGGEDEA
jgi:hypothetical protein